MAALPGWKGFLCQAGKGEVGVGWKQERSLLLGIVMHDLYTYTRVFHPPLTLHRVAGLPCRAMLATARLKSTRSGATAPTPISLLQLATLPSRHPAFSPLTGAAAAAGRARKQLVVSTGWPAVPSLARPDAHRLRPLHRPTATRDRPAAPPCAGSHAPAALAAPTRAGCPRRHGVGATAGGRRATSCSGDASRPATHGRGCSRRPGLRLRHVRLGRSPGVLRTLSACPLSSLPHRSLAGCTCPSSCADWVSPPPLSSSLQAFCGASFFNPASHTRNPPPSPGADRY